MGCAYAKLLGCLTPFSLDYMTVACIFQLCVKETGWATLHCVCIPKETSHASFLGRTICLTRFRPGGIPSALSLGLEPCRAKSHGASELRHVEILVGPKYSVRQEPIARRTALSALSGNRPRGTSEYLLLMVPPLRVSVTHLNIRESTIWQTVAAICHGRSSCAWNLHWTLYNETRKTLLSRPPC